MFPNESLSQSMNISLDCSSLHLELRRDGHSANSMGEVVLGPAGYVYGRKVTAFESVFRDARKEKSLLLGCVREIHPKYYL